MLHREITLENIRPFVRFAQEVYVPSDRKPQLVQAYDHRLFYIISGSGSIEIDGISREVSAGASLYWMSGTPYCIHPAEGTVLHLISINFDFTRENAASTQYLPMVSPQDYDPGRQLECLTFTDAPLLNGAIVIRDIPELLPYLNTIVAEAETPEIFSDFQQSCLLCAALNLLHRSAALSRPYKKPTASYRMILDYIQSHYAEDLSNHSLAEIFNYHPNYIGQLITKCTGVPLHQYLLKVRIRQALYLLQTTELPVAEIAQQVGFQNASYFSQYFKKCTGYSPSAFRIE